MKRPRNRFWIQALWSVAIVLAAMSVDFLPGPLCGVASGQDLVPLKLELPKPVFVGTPKNIVITANMEKPVTDKQRPALMVSKDTILLSEGKPVTSSDEAPIIGEVEMVTDGDKEAADGSYVELGPGLQWVQMDLEKMCAISAIVVWHFHQEARFYRDVVVQVSDNPDFISNVKTLYNSDYDNSSGLGVGKDKEYMEDYQGRLIEVKDTQARYIRLYSRGSTAGDMNHYIEAEVYGKSGQ